MKLKHYFTSLLKVAAIMCIVMSMSIRVDAQTQTQPQAESPVYLPSNIQEGVILHCFAWPLKAVIDELPAIAEAGFCALQLSPMQAPNVAGQPWYYTYGPCDYRFYDSVLGTREDLIELCDKASKYGIKIIMDIAANHMIHDKEDPIRAPKQYTDQWRIGHSPTTIDLYTV